MSYLSAFVKYKWEGQWTAPHLLPSGGANNLDAVINAIIERQNSDPHYKDEEVVIITRAHNPHMLIWISNGKTVSWEKNDSSRILRYFDSLIDTVPFSANWGSR